MSSIQEKIKKSIRVEKESVNDPNSGCFKFCSSPVDTFTRDVDIYKSCCNNKDIYGCCDDKCVLSNFPVKGPVGGEEGRRDILNEMRFQSSRNPTVLDLYCSGYNVFQASLGPGGEQIIQEQKKSGGIDREGKIIPYCKSKKIKVTDPNDPRFGQEIDIAGALEADPVFACACDERYGNCGEAEDYETCVMAKSKDIIRCLKEEKKLDPIAYQKAMAEFDRIFCTHKDDATPCRPCIICNYLQNVNPALASKINNPDSAPMPNLPVGPTGPSPLSPPSNGNVPTGPIQPPVEVKKIDIEQKKILPVIQKKKTELSETTKISLTVGGILLLSFIGLTISYLLQDRRKRR